MSTVTVDPMFGISLQRYGNSNKTSCWLLRLNYVNSKPTVTKVIAVGEDKHESLSRIMKIRDKELLRLMEQGYSPHDARYKVHPNRRNLSGINGVQLVERITRSGKSVYYAFKVYWNTGDAVRSRSFGCKKYGFLKAFEKAIHARREAELDVYGYTVLRMMHTLNIQLLLERCIGNYSNKYKKLQMVYGEIK